MKRFHVLSPKEGVFIFVGDAMTGKSILGRTIEGAIVHDDMYKYDEELAKSIELDKINKTVIITNNYVTGLQFYIRISGEYLTTSNDVNSMYAKAMAQYGSHITPTEIKQIVNARFGKRDEV